MPSDKFAQWWQWDDVLYKQTSTICKPKRIRIFALIINCTIIMKTNSRFSQNVYTISDRIWCIKHLRHTTTEKYDSNGKGGYFRFDDDNNMSYRYILSISYTEMGQLNIYNPIYCKEKKVIDRTSSMLTTPPEYTLQTFIRIQCLWVVLPNDGNGRQ